MTDSFKYVQLTRLVYKTILVGWVHFSTVCVLCPQALTLKLCVEGGQLCARLR